MAQESDDGIPRIPLNPEIDFGSGRRWSSPSVGTASAGPDVTVLPGISGMLRFSRSVLCLALPTETGCFPWRVLAIDVSRSAVLSFAPIVVIDQCPGSRLARPLVATGVLGPQ